MKPTFIALILMLLVIFFISGDISHSLGKQDTTDGSKRLGSSLKASPVSDRTQSRPKRSVSTPKPELVNRSSDEIHSAICRLQSDEKTRILDVRKITDGSTTHHFIKIAPPSDAARVRLLEIVNSLKGLTLDGGGEEIKWSDYLKQFYGLEDSYSRSASISYDEATSYVEFHSTIVLSETEAGGSVGSAIKFDLTKNLEGGWRYSHLIQLEEIPD